MPRLMGVDLGSKRIGIAVSDELGITAQGLRTMIRMSKENEFREISEIAERFRVEKIVVGLPKKMDGSIGKQAESVLKWAKALEERTGIPVVTWDERLSTVAATRTLLEADLSRRKRREVVDKAAAVLILQGFLDHQRGRSNDHSDQT